LLPLQVGVSNSIIDFMLSEEGIPLVPTSGGNEDGVHGLDSPLPPSISGPAGFLRRSFGHNRQSVGSNWDRGCTTPRFSHSSSFSCGQGSNRGPPRERFAHSTSFSGGQIGQGWNGGPLGERAYRRQVSAGARGGRGRRLSYNNNNNP
jgi:hypothetical protein